MNASVVGPTRSAPTIAARATITGSIVVKRRRGGARDGLRAWLAAPPTVLCVYGRETGWGLS
jgi:hypothetical protein